MIDEIQNLQLFDVQKTLARELFECFIYPFEVLPHIKEYIEEIGKKLSKSEFYSPSEKVWISKGARVCDSAKIGEYCIVEEGAEIRHSAYVRGCTIVGKKAVVGNSTEIKNSILFDSVQVPHYNYVGDSILGFRSHMGAGAVTSNVKGDKTNVVIFGKDFQIETNLRKCGAFLGDFVEIGCNSVLNPGCVIGCKSRIYPLSSVRGVIPQNMIYKSSDNVQHIREITLEN